jgi:hypothetical protein
MIAALASLVFVVLYLGIALFFIIAYWKIFVKAGQPGWGVLIPIYNLYLLMKIAGKPGWWLLLYLIPLVNVVIAIIVALEVAKAFGKSAAFAIFLLILFPFIGVPILGFGSAVYTPPAGTPA